MEEIDLKELISMFLEKKLLIILVVIIFALIGAIYTLKFVTPIYRSSTSLILAQTNLNGQSGETATSITSSDITLNANLVDNYKEIAESRIVARKVIENLGLSSSIEEIQENTTVSTSSDTEVLKITVSNKDPELACKIANELATVFTEQALEIYKVNNVNVLDEAVIPTSPANVNLLKNIVIFAFIGGVLVVGYILLINMLDTTVKTDLDIERTIHLPVLGSIVLTEDAPKKKKSKSAGKRSRTSSLNIGFNPIDPKSLQSFTNLVKKESLEENISMFSYMNKENQEYETDKKDENIEKPVRRYNASNNTNISKNLNNNSRKGGNR